MDIDLSIGVYFGAGFTSELWEADIKVSSLTKMVGKFLYDIKKYDFCRNVEIYNYV